MQFSTFAEESWLKMALVAYDDTVWWNLALIFACHLYAHGSEHAVLSWVMHAYQTDELAPGCVYERVLLEKFNSYIY